MNEEKVIQETENIVEEASNYYVAPIEAGNGSLGKVIAVGAAVATLGAVALVVKNKDKIRDWRIARHEKKLAKLKERKAKAMAESKESTEAIEVDATEVK